MRRLHRFSILVFAACVFLAAGVIAQGASDSHKTIYKSKKIKRYKAPKIKRYKAPKINRKNNQIR